MKKETSFLRRIITDQCADYEKLWNKLPNRCATRDRDCMFFQDYDELPRCKVLEEGLLPDSRNAKELAMYKSLLETGEVKVTSITSPCKKCGKGFMPKNNHQKYCDTCKTIVRREQARSRMQSKRKAASKVNVTQ